MTPSGSSTNHASNDRKNESKHDTPIIGTLTTTLLPLTRRTFYHLEGIAWTMLQLME